MSVETQSQIWWAKTRDDAALFTAWLYDQFRGEITAAGRILGLRNKFTEPGTKAHTTLTIIADQERMHAEWIADLLRMRGLPVEVQTKNDRYWPAALQSITDLATGAAVGAHAERMRLARIKVIAGDQFAPADVRETFNRIMAQERFHERAFRDLATPEALAATIDAHELGLQALGLNA
jgi:Rubrerythrin